MFITDPVFSERCSFVQFLGPKRFVSGKIINYVIHKKYFYYGCFSYFIYYYAIISPYSFLLVVPCQINELPRVDFVLISHNHYDHLDHGSILSLLTHCNPTFVVPLGRFIIYPSKCYVFLFVTFSRIIKNTVYLSAYS